MATRHEVRDEPMELATDVRKLDLEIADSWATEIRRRLAGIHQGAVVGVPADQASTRACARLRVSSGLRSS